MTCEANGECWIWKITTYLLTTQLLISYVMWWSTTYLHICTKYYNFINYIKRRILKSNFGFRIHDFENGFEKSLLYNGYCIGYHSCNGMGIVRQAHHLVEIRVPSDVLYNILQFLCPMLDTKKTYIIFWLHSKLLKLN